MRGLSAIILSYTNSEKIHQMNLRCIESLRQSEDEIPLEIIVVESNRQYLAEGYSFPEGVKVFVPEESFNFHRFLNIGIKASSQPFVALCNNDLVFHENWFSEILKVKKRMPELKSFCPVQPNEKKTVNAFELGYQVRIHIKGWCMVVEKDLFGTIGMLDEQFDFYYADDDYAMTLKKYHVKHALVNLSIVEHLGGENTESSREEGKIEFSSIVNKNPDLPKYLNSEGYKWILKNEKLLNGHLKFHEKWGSIRIISIKNKLFNLLTQFGLGQLVRW